ncbi:MAG: D-2-hydroxyacid dehydrogenase, partial [Candidatus Dormibacteraeota bacterium]|nr:D-2-hydroxyacid dehydrogenase [Candidatus Dormibacteraeota bacterium]
RRVLIFGYGQIGREIAQRLAGFEMDVTGIRRHPAGEAGVVGTDGWERLLPEADFLVLTAPLTEATRAVIGARELAAMKSSAYLVNVSRGALVDEAALVEALRKTEIAGAYLDVAETEPLPEASELWGLPNLIVSPHSSASSLEFEPRAVALFVDNLARFRDGRQLRNLVDMEAGY